MLNDIAALLLALTVNMVIIAIALPAVMGQVNQAARRAQAAAVCQALGWVLLMLSETMAPGSWQDRSLSTLSMAGISLGTALYATAFELWCGRTAFTRAPTVMALLLTAGYGLGFSNYAFRVGWANGLLAVQLLMVAVTLWRQPVQPVGRWRWLLVVALVAQASATFWRGILGAFATEQMPAFLSGHPVNFAFALVANATAVLTLIGVLLAHRDEAARALERVASVDDLSGVLNRRAWLELAGTELAVSIRYAHPAAVLMIDLDFFKRINDSRGHAAGDQALAFVGRMLKDLARAGDVVGRYGGEEFCVLMSHADLEAAQAFDRRMRQYMRDAAARVLGHGLNYSAGIAMRGEGDTLESLLKRADQGLYRAKAQGRGLTLSER